MTTMPLRYATALAVAFVWAFAAFAAFAAPAPAVPAAPGGGHGTGDVFARCADCHVPQGWHVLRSGGADGFDHDPTGFALRGRHTLPTCNACHKGTSLRGARCTTCHEDVHQGRQGDRCDGCHTSRDWRLPDALALHARTRFPLQGVHLTTPCRDCHRAAANDVWQGAETRCAGCHLADAAGRHPRHDAPPFTTRCEACHTAYGFRPAVIDHSPWWPLTGAHRTADCAQCHTGGRYRGTPERCEGCHTDDFRRGHEAGHSTDCADCHGTAAWLPASSVDHARFFPLPHRGVSACASCHPQGTTSLSCMTCHAHNRSEMAEEHDDVRGYAFDARACYRCHPRGRE